MSKSRKKPTGAKPKALIPATIPILGDSPVSDRMRRIADKVERGELAGDGNTIVRCALAELKEREVQLKIASFLLKHKPTATPHSGCEVQTRLNELETELAELKKVA